MSIDEIIEGIRKIMNGYLSSTDKIEAIKRYLDNIEATKEESNSDDHLEIGSLQL